MSQQPPEARQPNARFQQQAYSPPPGQQTVLPPPAKRQRLSPDAQSPGNIYSNGTYRAQGNDGNQYTAASPPGYSPQYQGSPSQQYNSFNTPQPFQPNRQWQQLSQSMQQRRTNPASPQGRDMMPPPPRPTKEENEKFGVDDVNDALFSSGINLKDEENYIHNTFTNRHSGTESFSSNPNVSFGSSNLTQNGSFNLLTQATSFSSQPNAAGAGTIGAAVGQDDVDAETMHIRSHAARKKAELDQHHLSNPFLLGDVLRRRLDRIAREKGVRLDTAGVYPLNPQTKIMMNGSNTEGIVTASVVDSTAPFADFLTLVSLATAERVRGLLDESHALAKARRYADYGRVPVEFADVAMGEGKAFTEQVVPQGITDTPWDQPAEGTAERLQTTIAFQSNVNRQLRMLAKRDEDAEKARETRRAARRKTAEAAANNEDPSVVPDAVDLMSSGAGDAGLPATKMTKKELVKQQKEKASLSEAQAATTTNQTAAMMALGGKRNRYSWMSGGAASMPTNRFAKPAAASKSGTATPSRKDGAKTPAGGQNGETTIAWGDWRENGEGGRGIQARDWLLVLERDGRDRMALEKTQLHLGTKPQEIAVSDTSLLLPQGLQTPQASRPPSATPIATTPMDEVRASPGAA